MHFPEIIKKKGKLAKIAYVCSDWTAGAAAAMAVALLLPDVVCLHPSFRATMLSAQAELGLCGFLGGSMGRGLFRLTAAIAHWVAKRVFGYDGKE